MSNAAPCKTATTDGCTERRAAPRLGPTTGRRTFFLPKRWEQFPADVEVINHATFPSLNDEARDLKAVGLYMVLSCLPEIERADITPGYVVVVLKGEAEMLDVDLHAILGIVAWAIKDLNDPSPSPE